MIRLEVELPYWWQLHYHYTTSQ